MSVGLSNLLATINGVEKKSCVYIIMMIDDDDVWVLLRIQSYVKAESSINF